MVSGFSNTNNLYSISWFKVFIYNTNNLFTIIWIGLYQSNINIGQSAGVVDIPTDSRQRVKTLPQWIPWYDTKWSDGEVPVLLEIWGMRKPIQCHHSQVHSEPEWYHLIGSYQLIE